MSAFTPHLAPVVVLMFLGTVLLFGASLLVFLYGALRRSAFITRLGIGAAAVVIASYCLTLTTVSFASSEEILPAGGWKYFCEIDCHIAYSVIAAQTVTVLGSTKTVLPQAEFVLVRVKTWFDENSISEHRGNGPLKPNARRVFLVDGAGRKYDPVPEAQTAMAAIYGNSTPLTQTLRPGESYTTDFVFDVPKGDTGLKLLITEDDPETRLVIGHENSVLHKKIYLGIQAAPALVETHPLIHRGITTYRIGGVPPKP